MCMGSTAFPSDRLLTTSMTDTVLWTKNWSGIDTMSWIIKISPYWLILTKSDIKLSPRPSVEKSMPPVKMRWTYFRRNIRCAHWVSASTRARKNDYPRTLSIPFHDERIAFFEVLVPGYALREGLWHSDKRCRSTSKHHNSYPRFPYKVVDWCQQNGSCSSGRRINLSQRLLTYTEWVDEFTWVALLLSVKFKCQWTKTISRCYIVKYIIQ